MKGHEEILKTGRVIVDVSIAGVLQRQPFLLEREETPFGKIPFLVPKNTLPLSAIMRALDETGLPIRSGGQKFFPKGKSIKEFAGL